MHQNTCEITEKAFHHFHKHVYMLLKELYNGTKTLIKVFHDFAKTSSLREKTKTRLRLAGKSEHQAICLNQGCQTHFSAGAT